MALIDLFGSVEEELIHHQIGHGLHEIETMHSKPSGFWFYGLRSALCE